jgi:hypothetical protein
MTKHSSWVGALLFVVGWGCAVAEARTKEAGKATGPDLSIGSAQFPDDDAVILRWEQHWTLEEDGTVRRRDHKWTKLLNGRPIRALADPRLDSRVGEDDVIIHTAQTILPDGSVLPVADYSFNKVGPDDVAGWPQYTAWEQTVICFGGIVDDCVLELDYEIVTKPGVLPWLEGDLRLHQDYPTVERVIVWTVPHGVVPHYRIDGIADIKIKESEAGGMDTYRWTFRDLPGAQAEPQSARWEKRCGRLWFTTCPGADEWVSTMLERVDRTASPGAGIEEFAQAVVEHEADPLERIRKIAKKLHDSFNFINSPKAMRSLECRTAAEVLRSNYGNPLEAGALLVAALQSLGMDVSLEVAVDSDLWKEEAPVLSAFAGIVAVVDVAGETVRVHPQHGVFKNPGHWGRHRLLRLDSTGKLQETLVRGRSEETPSEIGIAGKITIDPDGKAAGSLRIRLSGAFYDPRKLETGDQQEALIKDIVGRVLSDCTITKHAITTLSDGMLKATAEVASDGQLESIDKRHLLRLGSGPAFLPTFPLPLGRSSRATDVDMAGLFRESVDLTVELPEDWVAAVVPTSLPRVVGDWGTAEQTVEVDGRRVRIRRAIATASDTIGPDDFTSLREAVNKLKTEGSRILVVGPGKK